MRTKLSGWARKRCGAVDAPAINTASLSLQINPHGGSGPTQRTDIAVARESVAPDVARPEAPAIDLPARHMKHHA